MCEPFGGLFSFVNSEISSCILLGGKHLELSIFLFRLFVRRLGTRRFASSPTYAVDKDYDVRDTDLGEMTQSLLCKYIFSICPAVNKNQFFV